MIHKQVIHNSTILITHGRILCLAFGQSRNIVDGHSLEKLLSRLSANFEFAHVRNVKHSHPRANGKVFFDDAGGILDRHFVPAEFDQLCSERLVNSVKGSLFHFFPSCSFFQSARNRSNPISVSGCLMSCSMTLNGIVQISAPIIAASTTCTGCLTLATST